MRLLKTWARLLRIRSPVKSSDMPRDQTATSMSTELVGRWLSPRARRKEIQSPFVLPLLGGWYSSLSTDAGAGVKKMDGRHMTSRAEQ